jgi:hypothetical protein
MRQVDVVLVVGTANTSPSEAADPSLTCCMTENAN